MKTNLMLWLVVSCMVVLPAGLTMAVDTTITWTGDGYDGDWTNPDNWNGSFVSGTNNYAVIDYTGNGDPVVSTDISDVYRSIAVGQNSTSSVSLTMSAGGYLRTDTSYGVVSFGKNTGTSASCTMSGGTIETRLMYVAEKGQTTFDMTGGTINLFAVTGTSLYPQMRLGHTAGHGSCTFNMSGGTITANHTSAYIGVGAQTGGDCVFNMTGGQIGESGAPADRYLNAIGVGMYGNGTFNMTGGTILLKNQIRIGENPGGVGIFNMHGGLIETPNYVAAGWGTSSDGTTDYLNMDGGEIRCGDLIVGRQGAGVVSLEDGVININYFNASKTLQFNTGTGGAGLLDLCGGTLNWLYGDFASQIASFVTSGNIIAYDGLGTVSAIYDLGTNTTVITGVIPEPATITLLAAGLMFTLKRRRAE